MDSSALRRLLEPRAAVVVAGAGGPDWSRPNNCSRRKTTKWSASALYTRTLDAQRALSVTAAWGRRISDHVELDALALEAALNPARAWTVFARERTDNNELLPAAGVHGEPHTVAKISLGALRDFAVASHAGD